MKAYSRKRKKDCLRALKGGMTVAEIAKIENIPPGTIYGWISPRKKPTYHGDSNSAKIKAKLEAGETTASLIEQGFPSSTVHDVNRKLGLGRSLETRIANLEQIAKTSLQGQIPLELRVADLEAVGKGLSNGAPKMGLEQFVNLLRALVTDYELAKTELHTLEKSVEKWQQIAGSLNESILNLSKE